MSFATPILAAAPAGCGLLPEGLSIRSVDQNGGLGVPAGKGMRLAADLPVQWSVDPRFETGATIGGDGVLYTSRPGPILVRAWTPGFEAWALAAAFDHNLRTTVLAHSAVAGAPTAALRNATASLEVFRSVQDQSTFFSTYFSSSTGSFSPAVNYGEFTVIGFVGLKYDPGTVVTDIDAAAGEVSVVSTGIRCDSCIAVTGYPTSNIYLVQVPRLPSQIVVSWTKLAHGRKETETLLFAR